MHHHSKNDCGDHDNVERTKDPNQIKENNDI